MDSSAPPDAPKATSKKEWDAKLAEVAKDFKDFAYCHDIPLPAEFYEVTDNTNKKINKKDTT